MNSSAGEEILSTAEVSETNQVTVTTVTTTSTQTVAGTRAYHIPLFTSYAQQQALLNYSYQSRGLPCILHERPCKPCGKKSL